MVKGAKLAVIGLDRADPVLVFDKWLDEPAGTGLLTRISLKYHSKR
jgi:hypothetical protein